MKSKLISDTDSLRESKVIYDSERDFILQILDKEPGQNTTEEILKILTKRHLINICQEYHESGDYSIGYKIGINAAATLGILYDNVLPMRFYLMKKIDSISVMKSESQKAEEEELKKTVIVVDDIMTKISDLLLCKNFCHELTLDDSEYSKILTLRQHSKTIPNPHAIPNAYNKILHDDKKEIYKIYTNFLHFFAGNWNMATKNFNNVRVLIEELQKLCPIERLGLAHDIGVVMHNDTLDRLPEEIRMHLLALDPEQQLFFHTSFIKDALAKYSQQSMIEKLSFENEMRNIVVATQKNPTKNLIQFNIVLDSIMRCTAFLVRMQQDGTISKTQSDLLKQMQNMTNAMINKPKISVGEVYQLSATVVKSVAQEMKAAGMSLTEQGDMKQFVKQWGNNKETNIMR